ncbi:NAD(P)H-binding protein, partial [Pseudochelatococcus sp. B33]
MIVVTAPTSRIGTHLVSDLLEAGTRVRLIARDRSRLAPDVRERAEIVEGSHGDPSIVEEAFRGAEALFWLVPADPKADSVMAVYVDFSRPAVEAMVSHGVRRVVSVSALGRATPLADQAGYVTGSLAMDDLIADTGAAFRALVMPSFMDNILWQAASIRDQGLFFSPISGDLRLPSCATRDIAAVAARLLLDDTWSGQGETAVLGPEDLSFDDM